MDEFEKQLNELETKTKSIQKSMWLQLVPVIISLIGSILSTVGFLTFFFWESLEPYRWHLIVSDVVIVAIGEGLKRYFLRLLLKNVTDD